MKAIIILSGILGFLFLIYVLMTVAAIGALNKDAGVKYFDNSAIYSHINKQDAMNYMKENYSYKYNHDDLNKIDYKNIFIICKRNGIEYEEIIKALNNK
ncbi:MAG: hypothetical protein RSC57_03290 [Bacilli bacterium]